MTPEAEKFCAAIAAYLGEIPKRVKTGEMGYGWSGVYEITRWEASEACEKKAKKLADKIVDGAYGLIYRYSAGITAPHSLMMPYFLKAIEELKAEETK